MLHSGLVIRFSTDERFSCKGCTSCCRGLAIPVRADQAERYRGVPHAHGAIDPIVPRGDGLMLRHVDGACVFLEADGRCAIHARLGADAKPDACRSFPFTAAAAPDGDWFVRASFTCPTIVRSEGASGDELAAAVRRDVAPVSLPQGYRLGRHTIGAGAYERVESALTDLLAGADDLARALATAGAAVWELARSADPVAQLDIVLAPEKLAALARDARPYDRARDARLLLAPFLLLSAPPEQWRVSRAVHAVKLVLGRGRFRSAACGQDVPLTALERVRWRPDVDRGLVQRYVVHLLRSRLFLCEHPVEMAVTLVAVAYALVRWTARAHAALAGRDEVTAADVALAVPATDRTHFGHNVTEHWLLTGSVIGTWLALMFQGPRRIAGLVLERDLGGAARI